MLMYDFLPAACQHPKPPYRRSFVPNITLHLQSYKRTPTTSKRSGYMRRARIGRVDALAHRFTSQSSSHRRRPIHTATTAPHRSNSLSSS
eukprot:584627-Prorocentrum_minimum.AAC.1